MESDHQHSDVDSVAVFEAFDAFAEAFLVLVLDYALCVSLSK
jgi:hypothetical protein